ncbi:hypothetical protein [Nonomuraea jiangxiensis]|uniref:Uncharacterized protein n=1 Tax=Nonomuraea jiangxiensis TaxID=633440 RepID=A0A1G8PZ32_9ACTN|nr:hypothetical protein [Nonomuraea jiangxiensis]SDI97100.1 hypothetical protein SAMN05421869_10861 [Nonomuraea jiangxiensis]
MDWRGDDEILLYMRSVEGGDHLGWFLFGSTSGELRRLPRLPSDLDAVIGAPLPQ